MSDLQPFSPMAARCALLLLCLAGAALARPAHSPAQQQQELQKLFRAIDTDADQEISASEAASFAAAALDSSQESWSPQEVGYLMERTRGVWTTCVAAAASCTAATCRRPACCPAAGAALPSLAVSHRPRPSSLHCATSCLVNAV